MQELVLRTPFPSAEMSSGGSQLLFGRRQRPTVNENRHRGRETRSVDPAPAVQQNRPLGPAQQFDQLNDSEPRRPLVDLEGDRVVCHAPLEAYPPLGRDTSSYRRLVRAG